MSFHATHHSVVRAPVSSACHQKRICVPRFGLHKDKVSCQMELFDLKIRRENPSTILWGVAPCQSECLQGPSVRSKFINCFAHNFSFSTHLNFSTKGTRFLLKSLVPKLHQKQIFVRFVCLAVVLQQA